MAKALAFLYFAQSDEGILAGVDKMEKYSRKKGVIFHRIPFSVDPNTREIIVNEAAGSIVHENADMVWAISGHGDKANDTIVGNNIIGNKVSSSELSAFIAKHSSKAHVIRVRVYACYAAQGQYAASTSTLFPKNPYSQSFADNLRLGLSNLGFASIISTRLTPISSFLIPENEAVVNTSTLLLDKWNRVINFSPDYRFYLEKGTVYPAIRKQKEILYLNVDYTCFQHGFKVPGSKVKLSGKSPLPLVHYPYNYEKRDIAYRDYICLEKKRVEELRKISSEAINFLEGLIKNFEHEPETVNLFRGLSLNPFEEYRELKQFIHYCQYPDVEIIIGYITVIVEKIKASEESGSIKNQKIDIFNQLLEIFKRQDKIGFFEKYSQINQKHIEIKICRMLEDRKNYYELKNLFKRMVELFFKAYHQDEKKAKELLKSKIVLLSLIKFLTSKNSMKIEKTEDLEKEVANEIFYFCQQDGAQSARFFVENESDISLFIQLLKTRTTIETEITNVLEEKLELTTLWGVDAMQVRDKLVHDIAQIDSKINRLKADSLAAKSALARLKSGNFFLEEPQTVHRSSQQVLETITLPASDPPLFYHSYIIPRRLDFWQLTQPVPQVAENIQQIKKAEVEPETPQERMEGSM